MNFAVKSELKKFKTIYTQQESGKSFATAPDMFKAMGQQGGMYPLTQVTAKEHFVDNLGLSERLVEEFVMSAMTVNYGQSANTIDAFTAYVSLAGVEDGSLWSVVGGNWKIPNKVLEASGSTLHEDEVTAVTRIDQSGGSDGKVQYKITTEADGDVPGNFDVVIVANPLIRSYLSTFVYMLLLDMQLASTLTIQDFYPFGPEYNDIPLAQGDDVVASTHLDFPFFGEMYTSIGVSINPEIHRILHLKLCYRTVILCINVHLYLHTLTRYPQNLMGSCHLMQQLITSLLAYFQLMESLLPLTGLMLTQEGSVVSITE